MGSWTLGSLKRYVDRIIADHLQVHKAERRQLEYARKGIERRLQGLSRAARESQRREVTYLTRSDYESHHKDLSDRIERSDQTLDTRLDKHEATSDERFKSLEAWRATIGGRTVAALFIVGLFSGLIGVVLGHIFFG